jgi:uncharacterized protein (TIGR02284 family)
MCLPFCDQTDADADLCWNGIGRYGGMDDFQRRRPFEAPNLKALFESAARHCAGGAAELEAQVRSLGGVPAKGGSIRGSIHRAWTNIKSTITGMSKHAVLAECARGVGRV